MSSVRSLTDPEGTGERPAPVRDRPAEPWLVPPPATRGQNVAAGLILLALVGFISLSFWPGHMSADTLTQIGEVMSGDFTNWHTPILEALWKPFFDFGMGPGYVLFGQLVVFTGGCFLVLRTTLRPLAAAAVTALISLSPPVLGALGYLGRDTWFIALLVLSTGAVARASQATGRRRIAWIALAMVAAWLTLASRQNAAAAVVMPLIALVVVLGSMWRARRDDWPRRLSTRRRRAVGAVMAAVGLTLVLIATQYAVNAALGTTDSDPEQTLFVHDLAHMSVREDRNLLPREVLRDRSMRTLDRRYNPDSFTYTLGYVPGAPLRFPLSPSADSALRKAWREAILDHPLTYLDTRWDLWLRQLTIGRKAIWAYHGGIDPNEYGYAIRFPAYNEGVKDYLDGFADPANDGRRLFYSVWLYILLAVAAGLALLRWGRSPALLAVAMLGLAALIYQAGIFLGAMVTAFRFEAPVVVMAALSVAVLIGLWTRMRARAPSAA
jgi:hypothetical protein